MFTQTNYVRCVGLPFPPNITSPKNHKYVFSFHRFITPCRQCFAFLPPIQTLGNVHLTPREMSVLRRRFEKGTGEGLDVPAALLFFGRDEFQPISPESASPPDNEDTNRNEMDTEEELRRKRRQAQEEDQRSASDIEVRLRDLRTVISQDDCLCYDVGLPPLQLPPGFLGSYDSGSKCQLPSRKIRFQRCDACRKIGYHVRLHTRRVQCPAVIITIPVRPSNTLATVVPWSASSMPFLTHFRPFATFSVTSPLHILLRRPRAAPNAND